MLAIVPDSDQSLTASSQPPARLLADVAAAEASPPALVELLGLGKPSPKPRNKERENDQQAKAARRFLAALARRAVEGQDPEALAELLAIARWIEQELAPKVVDGLRHEDGGAHSWAEIAQAIGITLQTAQERFQKNAGRKPGQGARKGGGQPARHR